MSESNEAIPGYITVRLLGSGQFGDVFLVRRERDGRLFAAKVTRVGGEAGIREAQMLQNLRHPNIIRCEEVLRVGLQSRIVIVTEFADNGDLESYIHQFVQQNERIPEDEVMRLFIQISLALAYLHGQGILHRDLKPKNILIDGNGIAKLGDFGVSRALKNPTDVAVSITGTPTYMSPELMDSQPYDAKADVWSLGCILHELATSAPPFQAKALGALVMQIMSHNPPPLPPSYSRELDVFAKTLLSKDPKKRPTVKEVLSHVLIQRHVFHLASVAPSRLSSSAIPYPRQHQDCSAVQTLTPHQRMITAARPPQSTALSDASAREDEVSLRRQAFFENQAAALRNKGRVEREKDAPAPFLDNSEPFCAHAAPPPGRTPNLRGPEIESVREHTKQYYLENARLAKINKQRALQDLHGHSEISPHMRCSASPEAQAGSNVQPPPAPFRCSSHPPYEALLEEERRRVQQERKLLHERMRQHQESTTAVLISD